MEPNDNANRPPANPPGMVNRPPESYPYYYNYNYQNYQNYYNNGYTKLEPVYFLRPVSRERKMMVWAFGALAVLSYSYMLDKDIRYLNQFDLTKEPFLTMFFFAIANMFLPGCAVVLAIGAWRYSAFVGKAPKYQTAYPPVPQQLRDELARRIVAGLVFGVSLLVLFWYIAIFNHIQPVQAQTFYLLVMVPVLLGLVTLVILILGYGTRGAGGFFALSLFALPVLILDLIPVGIGLALVVAAGGGWLFFGHKLLGIVKNR